MHHYARISKALTHSPQLQCKQHGNPHIPFLNKHQPPQLLPIQSCRNTHTGSQRYAGATGMQSLHDITMHESQERNSPVQQTIHCLG